MRRLFLLIHAALIALCAAPMPGAAQETPDTAAISVVRAVMEHRIIWLQDPTLFNPCRLYEVLGRPDDLGRALGPRASRLLDQREEPCASPTLRAPITLLSVEVGDSIAAVQLSVTRGEYTYTEDYTLRKPEWRDWWGVSEIRMSGWGIYALPPPRLSPPEDTVSERTYHLSPPQFTLPKDTVSGAGSPEWPESGDDLSADEAALVEANVDSKLFEAVLRHTLARSSAGGVRVDPRPLRTDPSLATLHGLGEIVPDLVSPTAHHSPFADVEAEMVERRREVLAALGVDETDGLRYMACPGFMIPPSGEVARQRREHCPDSEYQIIMVALPRAGGVLLPPNTDERAKYADRPVSSVRVIRRTVGPRGSMETSADYVFERVDGDGWRLLEVRELMIVE